MCRLLVYRFQWSQRRTGPNRIKGKVIVCLQTDTHAPNDPQSFFHSLVVPATYWFCKPSRKTLFAFWVPKVNVTVRWVGSELTGTASASILRPKTVTPNNHLHPVEVANIRGLTFKGQIKQIIHMRAHFSTYPLWYCTRDSAQHHHKLGSFMSRGRVAQSIVFHQLQ